MLQDSAAAFGTASPQTAASDLVRTTHASLQAPSIVRQAPTCRLQVPTQERRKANQPNRTAALDPLPMLWTAKKEKANRNTILLKLFSLILWTGAAFTFALVCFGLAVLLSIPLFASLSSSSCTSAVRKSFPECSGWSGSPVLETPTQNDGVVSLIEWDGHAETKPRLQARR